MFDPISGQIDPREKGVSIAIQATTKRVIEREQGRSGLTKEQACATIARRIREAPGTIINLAKGRVKKIDAALRDKLTAYAVRQLETEIQGLQHELAIYRASHGDTRANRLDEIEALVARARSLLEG